MTNLDSLKAKFFVDGSLSERHLESIIAKAVPFCRTDKAGDVHLEHVKTDGKEKVMLTLIAKSIAHMLDAKIDDNMKIADIAKATGLPNDQIRVYASRLAKDKMAESTGTGRYKARVYKIESFLDGLAAAGGTKK